MTQIKALAMPGKVLKCQDCFFADFLRAVWSLLTALPSFTLSCFAPDKLLAAIRGTPCQKRTKDLCGTSCWVSPVELFWEC